MSFETNFKVLCMNPKVCFVLTGHTCVPRSGQGLTRAFTMMANRSIAIYDMAHTNGGYLASHNRLISCSPADTSRSMTFDVGSEASLEDLRLYGHS